MREPADIIQEFGGAAGDSCVFCAPKGFFIDNTRHARCNASIFAQRGWSADISMKIVYVWREKIKKYDDYPDDPKKVTIMLEAWNYSLPLKAARDTFTENELRRQIAKCETSGQYDEKYLYNTASFVSFPDSNIVELEDRKKTTFTVRVTIPPELPDELLNKLIPIIIMGDTTPRRVGFGNGMTNIIIVA